jgi:hypothetical protein
MHQMAADIARASSSDGLGSLADALDGVSAAIEGKAH